MNALADRLQIFVLAPDLLRRVVGVDNLIHTLHAFVSQKEYPRGAGSNGNKASRILAPSGYLNIHELARGREIGSALSETELHSTVLEHCGFLLGALSYASCSIPVGVGRSTVDSLDSAGKHTRKPAERYHSLTTLNIFKSGKYRLKLV